jgi:hypothetical protein
MPRKMDLTKAFSILHHFHELCQSDAPQNNDLPKTAERVREILQRMATASQLGCLPKMSDDQQIEIGRIGLRLIGHFMSRRMYPEANIILHCLIEIDMGRIFQGQTRSGGFNG